MMKEILWMVARGGMTFDKMSQDLGISTDGLRHKFMELERRGYIKEIDLTPSCSSNRCSKCPMGRSCSGDRMHPKMYELTAKGKRTLDRMN
jgi:predicted ArsR family transcriptional regulator